MSKHVWVIHPGQRLPPEEEGRRPCPLTRVWAYPRPGPRMDTATPGPSGGGVPVTPLFCSFVWFQQRRPTLRVSPPSEH